MEDGLKNSEQDYEEALAYLRTKLSQPEPEVQAWLNSIVDSWVSRRRSVRSLRKHGR